MSKQLSLLKAECKLLETKFINELKHKSPNQDRIQELEKLKRRVDATILKLLTRKSIAREMRYKRRAKRRSRLAYTYRGPTRYNFTF